MFIRITGAPVEIRTTQMLKVRCVPSVSEAGTPDIYGSACVSADAQNMRQYAFYFTFFYYNLCTDAISFLGHIVANNNL